MTKTDTLQYLFGARDAVSNMIINSTPDSDDERKQLRNLMQRRDRLTGAINQVITSEFNEAAKGLDDQVSAFENKTEELNGLGKTINDVEKWIEVVDAIVQLAAKVISVASS